MLEIKESSRVNFQTSPNILNQNDFYTVLIERMNKAIKSNNMLGFIFVNISNTRELKSNFGREFTIHALNSMIHRVQSVLPNDTEIGWGVGGIICIISDRQHKNLDYFIEILKNGLSEEYRLSNEVTRFLPAIVYGEYPGVLKEYSISDISQFISIITDAQPSNECKFSKITLSKIQDAQKTILLRKHLSNGDKQQHLFVEYQPKVDIESSHILGCEALLRFQHPTIGRIGPDNFIPILESSGEITKVTTWLIEETSKIAKNLQTIFGDKFSVGINLSILDLQDPNFAQNIANIVQEQQIDTSLIDLEVTENHFIDRPELAIPQLHSLKELGFHIAIDDFGKGYSSLSLLPKLPLDSLKIDKLFVDELNEPQSDKGIKIISIIQDIANTYDLDVIVEGIETKEQAALLEDIGIKKGQGYYYSKPISFDKFAQYNDITKLPLRTH